MHDIGWGSYHVSGAFGESSAFEALVPQGEAVPVPGEHFDHRAAAVDKDEQVP